MAEDEGEDFIFYGTPIEREEDTSARKRKSIADAGQLRSLPAWKQEVRDEEGRRRFHGAFTGGYSAGYYNTVGSKEGWTPQTFTSSRKHRAEAKRQSIYNFLDDDDMKDMRGHALETSSQFDTFGFTAAEIARKQAEKEQQKRPSAIPGPVPDEILLPATNSIGVKLLVKMGWRAGHAIKAANENSSYDARREARKAFLAFSGNEENSEHSQAELSNNNLRNITERCDDNAAASQNTPVYVLHPKQDLHGLGYDPFKHAPEFRDRKRLRDSRCNDKGSKTDVSTRSRLSGKYAPGFGIGALEELDIEDEDIYASGFDYVGVEIEEEEPSRVITDNKLKLEYRKKGVLSGFKVASSSDYNLERFHPPVIPSDFEPYHKFTSPLETLGEFAESPPPEVPPPEDNSLRLLIEGFATLVARSGKLFEDLSKEKNKSNPLFSFLSGGNGNDYYARKLWEAKQKSVQRRQEVHTPSDRKMTAESRGRILDEKPLERSTKDSATSVAHKEVLQSNLIDTFTKPKSALDFSERTKPFGDDLAKQERFEQFLKDKYQGGLRSKYSGSTSTMSETERARERLDFEAAAEAIEKGEWNTKTNIPSSLHAIDLLARDNHFVSSSAVEQHQISKVEESMDKIYPKREEFQWRPSPILCKRFDLIDPFMGKPPPAPRARSKLDTLIFMPDSFPNVKSVETDAAKRESLSLSQSEPQESEKIEDPDVDTNTSSVQRPVDLYKAIFSDDSDDEADNVSINNNVAEDPEKKIEGVNKTLNRLVAGDFLESLGKELGLEIPTANTTSNCTSLTEVAKGTDRTSLNNEKPAHTEDDKIDEPVNIIGTNSTTHADTRRKDPSLSPMRYDGKEGKAKAERREHRSKKHRSHSRRHKHSSTSDSSSLGDNEFYYDRSKSRSKSKSRKHSDHHRRKRSRSPRYSSHDKHQSQSDDGRTDGKSRDTKKHSRKRYH